MQQGRGPLTRGVLLLLRYSTCLYQLRGCATQHNTTQSRLYVQARCANRSWRLRLLQSQPDRCPADADTPIGQHCRNQQVQQPTPGGTNTCGIRAPKYSSLKHSTCPGRRQAWRVSACAHEGAAGLTALSPLVCECPRPLEALRPPPVPSRQRHTLCHWGQVINRPQHTALAYVVPHTHTNHATRASTAHTYAHTALRACLIYTHTTQNLVRT